MAFTFELGGVEKALKPGWRISETLNGRNTMEFAVDSYDGLFRPPPRTSVEFDDSGTLRFAGLTHGRPREHGFGGTTVSDAITNNCAAVDYNIYPERRLVELTIPAGSTLKQALQQIEAYLIPYGVSLHASQDNGPTFAEAVVLTVAPISSHLDKLSLMTNYRWDISYGKVLHMAAPGTQADGSAWNAPFNIAANSPYVMSDIEVVPSLTAYGNTVMVRYSGAALNAYAFYQMLVNRTDGHTAVVGKTYTFKDDITGAGNVDGNVKIGATANITLQHLHRAITLQGLPGVDYAAAMTVNAQVTAGMQDDENLKVVAHQPGLAGNSISVESTGTGASWRTEGGEVTTTLQFGQDAQLTEWVTATTDPDPEDREDLYFEHPEIHDRATAQLMANGYLARAQAETDEIHYITHTGGVHPGMKQTIVEPKRNLNSSTCLIVSVDIVHDNSLLVYHVVAVEQLVIPQSHLDFWSGGSSSSAGGLSGVLTGGGTAYSMPFPLGGSRSIPAVLSDTTWRPIAEHTVLPALPVDYPARIRMEAWTRTAAIAIRYRLRNITDSTTTIESGAWTPGSTRATPGTQTLDCVVPAGAEHQLEVLANASGGNGEECYARPTIAML